MVALREQRFQQAVSGNPIECWIWPGRPNADGYGTIKVDGAYVRAHRWVWQRLRGPIPEGLDLDHVCRVRNCVNPDHLEPVTRRENTRRGISVPAINGRRTHCKWGHPFDEENTKRDGRRRSCRACIRRRNAEMYVRRQERRLERAS